MQNFVQRGEYLDNVTPTYPASPTLATSGEPVLLGLIPGVAATNAGDGNNDAGNITMATQGVFTLSVQGINGSGNVAVAEGDHIYLVAANTPPLSKVATGVLFGKALGTVGSGSTATIPVMLIQA